MYKKSCIFENGMNGFLHHSRRSLLSIIVYCCANSLLWAFDPAVYMQIRAKWSSGEVQASIEQINKQLKKEKNEAQWYWLLDDIYASQNNTEARINTLERALGVKKLTEKSATILRLGNAYFDSGDYQQAQKVYTSLPTSKARERALHACRTADSLRSNPVNIERISMGDSVNLPYDNIWPALTADGSLFCSTVVMGKRGFVGNTLQLQEDIYISRKEKGIWQPATALPFPINTESNEGSPCFSADGKYLFFVRCAEHGGIGSCDIYYCIKKQGKWSKPILAPAPLNSKYWESTPCLSADGNTLYFSSNRPDGMGKKDIWSCNMSKLPDGKLQFEKPQNIGSPINTPYDEIAPFIHANDSTLYFSSNGHFGMGGLDIFYSKRQSTNRWGEPQNIGYPINTHADEMGWTVSADGTTAYLAADSSLSQGSHKIIYQILLPEVIQPQPATPLQLLSVQDTIHLHHIYFDFDKSSLKPESESELRQLVKLINTYPDKTYTITGHTDNVGNEEYNRILSRQRAETIVNYLIQHGINPNILKYQGMGSSEPIESNSTEWGRSKNRRIEVSIQ